MPVQRSDKALGPHVLSVEGAAPHSSPPPLFPCVTLQKNRDPRDAAGATAFAEDAAGRSLKTSL